MLPTILQCTGHPPQQITIRLSMPVVPSCKNPCSKRWLGYFTSRDFSYIPKARPSPGSLILFWNLNGEKPSWAWLSVACPSTVAKGLGWCSCVFSQQLAWYHIFWQWLCLHEEVWLLVLRDVPGVLVLLDLWEATGLLRLILLLCLQSCERLSWYLTS